MERGRGSQDVEDDPEAAGKAGAAAGSERAPEAVASVRPAERKRRAGPVSFAVRKRAHSAEHE